jgi:hypothetical protein
MERFTPISDNVLSKRASSNRLDEGSAQRAWSRVTTLLDDNLYILVKGRSSFDALDNQLPQTLNATFIQQQKGRFKLRR